MAKLTLADVTNILGNPTSAANTINNNSTLTEAALEKTLSRDGTSPNQMEADLDMNHNDVLNAKTIDADELILNGKVVTPDDLQTVPNSVMLKTVYDPFLIEDNVFDRRFQGDFNTEADFVAASISAPVMFITTAGYYSIGDGGGHSKKRVSTPAPAKAWHKQSADGSWWEIYGERIHTKYFGTVGDDLTNEEILVQATIDLGSQLGVEIVIDDGLYNVSNFNTPSDCVVRFSAEAWIRPRVASTGGAVISNIRNLPSKTVSNITLINPQVDGIHLPFITPDDDNGIGYATGADNIHIIGGWIKNFRATVVSGPGGKGIGFEEGVSNVLVDGTRVDDCTYATFISPTLDDPAKFVNNIHFTNMSINRCAAIGWALADAGTALVPTSDPKLCSAMWTNIVATDCGHYPDLPMTSGKIEKSGAFLSHGASNLFGRNITLFNNPTYPSVQFPAGGTNFPTGYPAQGTDFIGAGLSGGIGAPFQGWGRNIDFEMNFTGDCDDVVSVSFPRAHRGLSFAGGIVPVGCSNFNVKVTKRGTHGTLLRSGFVGGHTGTLQVGGTTTVTLAAAASDRDGEYAGQNFQTTGGTGSGQTIRIIHYNGSTRVATLASALSPAADGTTTYAIAGSTTAVASGQITGLVSFDTDTPTLRLVDASARFPTTAQIQARNPAGFTVDGTWLDIFTTYNSFSDLSSIRSGPWIPTLTNGTNVAASTANNCRFIKVGNQVHVSGFVTIDPTAAGSTILDMSLPVPSNFLTSTDAGGTFSDTGGESGNFFAEVTTDRLRFSFVTVSTANRLFGFSGAYSIF